MKREWRKALRICVYATLGLAAVAVAIVFAIPQVLELPSIKAQLEQRLSQAAKGQVTWGHLEIRLLPLPRAVVDAVRLEIPGRLQARAEQVEVRVKLLPLLHGRAEIVSLSAQRPQVSIQLAPAAAAPQKAITTTNPFATYRSAADAVVGAVRAFAPETVLAIQEAEVDIRTPDGPLLRLRDLSLRARTGRNGMDLELAAASDHWSRLRLGARVEYADFSGNAMLEIDGLRPQPWLDAMLARAPVRVAIPAAELRLKLRTDGRTSVESEVHASVQNLDVARETMRLRLPPIVVQGKARADAQRADIALSDVSLGGEKLAQGTVGYAFGTGVAEGDLGFDLDLARTLTLARQLLPAQEQEMVESVAGRLRGSLKVTFDARQQWAATLEVRDSDAAARVPQLPWAIGLRAGRMTVEPTRMSIAGLQGTLGASSFTAVAARVTLGNVPRIQAASGQATLVLDQLYPWAQQQERLAALLKDVPLVAGTVDANLLRLSGTLDAPDYELRLVARQVRVQAKPLPAALTADGGAVRVTPTSIAFERLAVTMLDARTMLSGTISDYATQRLRADVALHDGIVGAQVVDWAMQLGKLPPKLVPRVPLRFSADRVRWGPGRRLELDTVVRFDTGIGVTTSLSWTPELLDLRRVELEDARGKGALALRARGRILEGRFAGTFHGGMLAALLQEPPALSGEVAGDLKFDVDLDRWRHASGEGTLQGAAVDLAWLAGRPLVIERFALAADRSRLRIDELLVKLGEQSATLRGELARSEAGPVIDAHIESPGIVLDALLPEAKAEATQPAAATTKLWPLPITGRIALRVDQVQYKRYRIAPLVADLRLEEERAHLEVKEAQMCGIASPLSVDARPGTWDVAVRVAMQRQPVEAVARCLTSERVQINGEADFQATLRTHGQTREFLRNLEGTVAGEVRDGRVQKFALIGNILSARSITDITNLAEEGTGKRQEGFAYHRLAFKGRFRDGQFLLEEGAFDSEAVGMAANGTIRLSDLDSRLTVLVAPFGRLDRLVRKIPIIGYVMGGALTSVPVAVTGDIRDPLVVPLGPRAITSELVGIFERTLKLPGRLLPPATQ